MVLWRPDNGVAPGVVVVGPADFVADILRAVFRLATVVEAVETVGRGLFAGGADSTALPGRRGLDKATASAAVECRNIHFGR